MDLKKYYIDKEDVELIEILENFSDYTEECVLVVKDIFTKRNLSLDKTEELALVIIKQKIQKVFEKLNISQEEIIPHESPFLNKSKMRKLYQQELKQYIENRPDIDVWSYSIGGV